MFLLGKVMALALVMQLPAQASAAVQLDILVIEAKRGGKPLMPAKLKQMKLDGELKRVGFTNAKILDQLPANVEDKGSVSLEIVTPFSKKKQMLTVKVLKVKGDTIDLEIAVPSQKNFKAKTQHKNGAALLVVASEQKGTALILAVKPKP